METELGYASNTWSARVAVLVESGLVETRTGKGTYILDGRNLHELYYDIRAGKVTLRSPSPPEIVADAYYSTPENT